ncbi:MAG: hypothetical protein ACR2HJ_05570 [Fimbriimonadales bacterium]
MLALFIIACIGWAQYLGYAQLAHRQQVVGMLLGAQLERYTRGEMEMLLGPPDESEYESDDRVVFLFR